MSPAHSMSAKQDSEPYCKKRNCCEKVRANLKHKMWTAGQWEVYFIFSIFKERTTFHVHLIWYAAALLPSNKVTRRWSVLFNNKDLTVHFSSAIPRAKSSIFYKACHVRHSKHHNLNTELHSHLHVSYIRLRISTIFSAAQLWWLELPGLGSRRQQQQLRTINKPTEMGLCPCGYYSAPNTKTLSAAPIPVCPNNSTPGLTVCSTPSQKPVSQLL